MRGIGRLSMTLATGMLAVVALGAPAVAQQPMTFATPEDAVAAYLQGVADADAAEVLAASAVDQMATNLDFPAYIDRLQAWVPQGPAPATHPMLIDFTLAQQQGMLLGQTRNLVYGLLTDLDLSGGIIAPADSAWAQALVDQLDLARLSGLAVGGIVPPDPDVMASERYLDTMAKQAAVWGADEMTERVATVSLEGRDWLVGFTLMRFGDDWRVAFQTSAIGGTSANGAPMPVGE